MTPSRKKMPSTGHIRDGNAAVYQVKLMFSAAVGVFINTHSCQALEEKQAIKLASRNCKLIPVSRQLNDV